jgi:hypothetical protein
MARRIRAVSRKGRIRRNADIFVGGDGGSFGFRASVGKEPTGKSAGEAAWNVSTSRSRRRNGSAQATGCARSRFLDFGLRLVKFRLRNWRRRRSCGLSAILGKRLAWEKNGFFRDRAGSGGTGSFGRAMIKAALRGTTGFKTTGLPAAIFWASLITATIIVAAGLVSARLAALRRSVFGRREVASAYIWALRASAAMASATAAPSAATATVAAAITTPVSTAIGTTAIALAGAIAAPAGARRVILRGIVVRREILRCGGVRIGLALFRVVVRIVVDFGGVSVGDFAFRSVFLAAGLLVVRERFMAQRFMMRIFFMQCFVRFVRGFFAVSVVGVLFFMFM